MTRKPVIAVDGYSSTGKSSISKIIAKQLGLIHLDTGALYRGITLFALQNCNHNSRIDFECLKNNLHQIHLEFRDIDGLLVLFLNGKNVTKEIRTQEISDNVSLVAKQPEVRHFLLETQRKMADNGGIIMDGRDIGTVVLPNADYKFFMTASPDERARRRFAELQQMGMNPDFESVKKNLLERDKIDSERNISPLKQADDAILIDNTKLDKQQTIDLMLSYIK